MNWPKPDQIWDALTVVNSILAVLLSHRVSKKQDKR